MAKERDPLTPEGMTPEEAGYAEPPGGAPATTASYNARDKNPRDIERDIDHTRAEMSETLDAIGARFQPDYIKEQAKDAFRSTARDAGTTMIDTIKENPIPSLIAGLSLGWLVAKGGESDRDRYYRVQFEDDYYRRYGRYPDRRATRAYVDSYRYDTYRTGYDGGYTSAEERSLRDRAGEATGQAQQKAHQAKEKAGHLADQVQGKAHQAKEKASHLADQATDQAQDFADEARTYGRRAENWLERQMNENPLMMGALSLAAGALVGLAVPETRKEDEWMGRQSDRLKHQARDAAEEKLEQAKRVAEATADEAKDKAKDVAETAKSEAKKQDLDEPPKTTKSDGQKSGSGTSAIGGTPNASGSTTGGSSRS